MESFDTSTPHQGAPIPANEAVRMDAVARYRLGGLGREPVFDHIAQLATDLFDVPMSVVSILDADMQCFRGACGLDDDGTSRDLAFCAFAILDDGIMVVPDATLDPRFRNNPMVTGEPFVRFYAGVPLIVGGQAVGTLCLIDRVPRELSDHDRGNLERLARTVVDLIELRVERFEAEEQRRKLAEERELLKLTVENVTEGVALVDGDLRLILWNESFATLFDYDDQVLCEGCEAAKLMRITADRGELGPGDPAQIVDAFVHSIRSSESRRIEIRRTDGTMLEIWRKTISGNRFIMTARDVTHERQAARLKDELVSTVSHELRTPLTAISGALHLMGAGSAGELPPQASNLVAIGRRNADRLIALVNDLLEMDKLQSGKLSLELAETDLRQLVAESAEQNQPYGDRYGVTLKTDLPGAPVRARVDVRRIQQVMSNLLSNACKFSPRDTEVCIVLSEEDGWARISVSDQGPGISPEFRPRLFTRFAQEDGSHQRGHAGTGLGLAITKGIVEAHRGTIELESQPGKGATFAIRLPRAG